MLFHVKGSHTDTQQLSSEMQSFSQSDLEAISTWQRFDKFQEEVIFVSVIVLIWDILSCISVGTCLHFSVAPFVF